LIEHVTLETHDNPPATPRARRLRSSEQPRRSKGY
jgi:hypothetical protein